MAVTEENKTKEPETQENVDSTPIQPLPTGDGDDQAQQPDPNQQPDESQAEQETPSPDATQASDPQSAETAETGEDTASPDEGQQEEDQGTMLTQSQVDAIAAKARAEGRKSALKELYGKYGVDTDKDLDELLGNGERYGELNEQYKTQEQQIADLQSENVLLKSRIDPSKFDDVKAILSFKNLEVTPENVASMMQTHPEWVPSNANQPQILTPQGAQAMVDQSAQNAAAKPAPEASQVIPKLGGSPEQQKDDALSEHDKAMKLFGV